MSTAANIYRKDSSHWYYPDGRTCYELPKASGDGMKVPTLADAKKLNLLPSVTTILKIMDKPGLNRWLTEQACLALLTTPRLHVEKDDEFVNRVLNVERQQEQESDKARQLGTDIHAALELAVQGKQCDPELRVFVDPVLDEVWKLGEVFEVEKILVGDGYAGKCDLILEAGKDWTLVDFKTTKSLPKKAYPEHKLQLSAYAKAWRFIYVQTYNMYISTEEPGKVVTLPSGTLEDYEHGFVPLLKLWQWLNNYVPGQEL